MVVDSDHSGEVPVGGAAVPSSSGASIGTGGPAGEVPARDGPDPSVMGGVPPCVLPVGEVPVRVPVHIAAGGAPLLFSQ